MEDIKCTKHPNRSATVVVYSHDNTVKVAYCHTCNLDYLLENGYADQEYYDKWLERAKERDNDQQVSRDSSHSSEGVGVPT
jgi:transcription elongation factor Elf1